MFVTMTRANVKAENAMEATNLIKREVLPSDGKKLSEVVDGLLGFGLMKSKTNPDIYAVVSIWATEEDFMNFTTHPAVKRGEAVVEKLKKLIESDLRGEGFYFQMLEDV